MNNRSPKAQNNPTDQPEKQVLSFLKSLWLGSCARYTVLCLILLLISAAISSSLTVTYVDTIRFFLLLPFALCLTLAAMVRRTDKISVGLRFVLHPVLVLGGFGLCCYLPYYAQLLTKPSGMQVFLVLLLVGILYAVCMGIYIAVTYSLGRQKTNSTEYVSQFGKKS